MSVKNTLVRIAKDVFVNFYEIASIEACDDDDDGALIVLKNGHKIFVENISAGDVNSIVRDHINHCNGTSSRSYNAMSPSDY